MKERLVLVNGKVVSVVAQDKEFGDAENFTLSRSDAETCNLIGAHGNTYTVEKVKEYMPEPSLDMGDKKIFTIISNSDGRYIGDIRLVRINNEVFEIGICILPEERSKGYGTDAIKAIIGYAFNSMEASKVTLRVYQNNPRAKRLYERLGFRDEKTVDDNYIIDGVNYLEDVMYINK